MTGEHLKDEEVNELFSAADLDGDGYFNYDEFVRFMSPN